MDRQINTCLFWNLKDGNKWYKVNKDACYRSLFSSWKQHIKQLITCAYDFFVDAKFGLKIWLEKSKITHVILHQIRCYSQGRHKKSSDYWVYHSNFRNGGIATFSVLYLQLFSGIFGFSLNVHTISLCIVFFFCSLISFSFSI